MKGIVIEELKYKLIILTEKGDFIEIDKLNTRAKIGQEINIKSKKISTKKALRRFALAATAMLIFFIINSLIYGMIFTREYVVVDINPNNNKNVAMEIHYNYFGNIIKLQAANKKGVSIVKKMRNLKFKATNVVINNFIRTAQNDKFIDSGKQNTIVITIASSSKSINDESIDSSLEHYIKENKINARPMIVLGNDIDYKKSKQVGIPIDKFILINKVIKNNPSYKFYDLNKKSIDELINIANQEENY
ncbi:hypothetical protein NL50_00700 [Clostridium acetobutylicum]|nr:hypothetical protein NL50_00700 [Clostridium acetobutylicum]